MRQIVLDTETTGLEPSQGHRIIEIGCVEIINRRLTGNHFHQYLNPDRDIDAGALEVHGITAEFLRDKPRFDAVCDDLLAFIDGTELVIHNAPFDIAFLRRELELIGRRPEPPLEERCKVVDTLTLARTLHPGQKNTLDALCKRYGIDNSQRTLHGALLDAEILADVYLAMTGGQSRLFLEGDSDETVQRRAFRRLPESRPRLPVLRASEAELARHQAVLDSIDRASGGACLWRRLEWGQTQHS
jgi:DNA polymerase-3 subunit epsilon